MQRFPLLLLCAVASAYEPVPEEPPSPADIAELTFGEPSTWARPIDDYIEVNAAELGHDDFLQGIHDLHVFQDRLYFGYGDANLNLGQVTPIEIRRWTEPLSGAWEAEFIVDEEQIDRFRSAGDTLVVPGADATEDAWIGNAYTLHEGGS